MADATLENYLRDPKSVVAQLKMLPPSPGLTLNFRNPFEPAPKFVPYDPHAPLIKPAIQSPLQFQAPALGDANAQSVSNGADQTNGATGVTAQTNAPADGTGKPDIDPAAQPDRSPVINNPKSPDAPVEMKKLPGWAKAFLVTAGIGALRSSGGGNSLPLEALNSLGSGWHQKQVDDYNKALEDRKEAADAERQRIQDDTLRKYRGGIELDRSYDMLGNRRITTSLYNQRVRADGQKYGIDVTDRLVPEDGGVPAIGPKPAPVIGAADGGVGATDGVGVSTPTTAATGIVPQPQTRAIAPPAPADAKPAMQQLSLAQTQYLNANPKERQYISSQYQRLNNVADLISGANSQAAAGSAGNPVAASQIGGGSDAQINIWKAQQGRLQTDIKKHLDKADALGRGLKPVQAMSYLPPNSVSGEGKPVMPLPPATVPPAPVAIMSTAPRQGGLPKSGTTGRGNSFQVIGR